MPEDPRGHRPRPRRSGWGLLAGALLLGAPVAAGAQEEAAPPPAPLASPSPQGDSRPVFSGYAQVDYRRGDHESASAAPEHEVNVRRARLSLSGKATPRVAYSATIQGDGLNRNTASFRDFYADVTLAGWLRLRAGQYKYDFDMEGRESSTVIPLPDRPFVTVAVVGGLDGESTPSSGSGDFRDRGVSLIGSVRQGGVRWGYAAGLFQGSGRGSDDNTRFGYTLRLNVEPVAGLRLSGGLLGSDNRDQGTLDEDEYSAWTAGASYEKDRIFARSEYYGGRRRRAGGRQDLDGFYVVGGYRLHPRLDAVLRYQRFEDERNPAGSDASSVDLGLKLFLQRDRGRSGTFLTLACLIRDADPGMGGLTVLNDGRGDVLESGADVAPVFVARLQVRF